MEGFIRQAGHTRSSWPQMLVALAATTLSLVALGFIVAGKAYTQDSEDDPGGEFAAGEIVAKLNLANLGASGTCQGAITEINAEYGTTTKEIFLQDQQVACIYLLQTSIGDENRVAGEVSSDEKISYAEPNFTTEAPEGERHRHFGYTGSDPSELSPNGTKYDNQYAVGALRLGKAHRVNGGGGSTIAVLDTGVQKDHPGLDGRMIDGESFVSESTEPTDTGNGLDDDGDNEKDEMVGHGTHVAGIVHLAAPNAEIMPLRVLDSDGNGNVYLIAEALQYAVDRDVDVINMSFGTSRPSRLIQDVSDDLEAEDDDDDDGGEDGDDNETGPALTGVPLKGAVAVGAAGNDSLDQRRFPAAEANVIGVASANKEKRKSGFSNYGKGWIDISAPGTDIYSTFPDGRYAEWSGTSMAAPFVSGQAALIRSQKPGLKSTAPKGEPSVTKIIKNNASSLNAGSYRGKLGAGHADAYNSLR